MYRPDSYGHSAFEVAAADLAGETLVPFQKPFATLDALRLGESEDAIIAHPEHAGKIFTSGKHKNLNPYQWGAHIFDTCQSVVVSTNISTEGDLLNYKTL